MPQLKFADLQVNQPVDGAAPDATLILDVDPSKPMRLGSYVFRLQVSDDSGNLSEPVEFKLSVVDEGKPVAVITGPTRVPFGRSFTLSGERSRDTEGGTVAKFSWMLIEAP
ncbi:MAG: hypothetical protein JWQ44_2857 [Chthoniobacter sp.]|jgi:hypothetical protein|nr:hypothetical protein [Chthoniobacter sp.]